MNNQVRFDAYAGIVAVKSLQGTSYMSMATGLSYVDLTSVSCYPVAADDRRRQKVNNDAIAFFSESMMKSKFSDPVDLCRAT